MELLGCPPYHKGCRSKAQECSVSEIPVGPVELVTYHLHLITVSPRIKVIPRTRNLNQNPTGCSGLRRSAQPCLQEVSGQRARGRHLPGIAGTGQVDLLPYQHRCGQVCLDSEATPGFVFNAHKLPTSGFLLATPLSLSQLTPEPMGCPAPKAHDILSLGNLLF